MREAKTKGWCRSVAGCELSRCAQTTRQLYSSLRTGMPSPPYAPRARVCLYAHERLHSTTPMAAFLDFAHLRATAVRVMSVEPDAANKVHRPWCRS
ncbi:hypothetical protein PATSB16_24570 [Pandoraea thiooxydans]|nr:hypothetical protein PATSB16_24570 [Pandoraea thiooxydans]